MACEVPTWEAIPLDDLTEEETPITYGVVKPGEEGEVSFVRGGDIAGGRVLMDQLRTIGRDVSQQYRRTLLRGGEILVSLVGNPGQVAIAPTSLAGANIARQVGLVRLRPGIDARFVSYFLQSRDGQTALGAQSLGSVQQVINLRDLKQVKVPLPPLDEQKAIAAVLGALDDKIELNRRMNATLEAMARALFQSWFVDFDPVRSKLDGRQPVGIDPAIAALFPSHFDHKAEGVVPTGWNLKRWGDIATLEYGKSIRDYRESSGKYRVFGTNGPIGFHDEALCNSAGIVIGRKGAYRGVHYSPEPFFVIDTAFYLKPKAALDLKWAYYELLRFDINSMDSGSAIPSTSRDDFWAPRKITGCDDASETQGRQVHESHGPAPAESRIFRGALFRHSGHCSAT